LSIYGRRVIANKSALPLLGAIRIGRIVIEKESIVLALSSTGDAQQITNDDGISSPVISLPLNHPSVSTEIIDGQRSLEDRSENILQTPGTISDNEREINVRVWDDIYIRNMTIKMEGKSSWKHFTYSNLEDPKVQEESYDNVHRICKELASNKCSGFEIEKLMKVSTYYIQFCSHFSSKNLYILHILTKNRSTHICAITMRMVIFFLLYGNQKYNSRLLI
jgi:hypothetical protein